LTRIATAFLPAVWHEAYEVDIGSHVFVTSKNRRALEQLLADGTLTRAAVQTPEPATDDQVRLAHDAAWVEKILAGRLSVQEQWALEVPFSSQLREAMWRCAGGSLLTARLALRHGIAVHLGGGFHHAFSDHGEGFCLINDVAIALRVLLAEGELTRAAVIDCDLHHGNGTAAIFTGDPAVFTFSIHQERNYPAWKPPGDLDVGLDDGTGDEAYLAHLERELPRIVERQRPQLVFYLAGADPYREDQLGGLALTLEGLRQRDRRVFETFAAASVPVAVVLAGGYAIRPEDTVTIHCNTVREARRVFDGRSAASAVEPQGGAPGPEQRA